MAEEETQPTPKKGKFGAVLSTFGKTKITKKICESCGWEGQLEGNKCPKCGGVQFKTVRSVTGKTLTFLIYFAVIEILLFTFLAPIRNLISAGIDWSFGIIAPGWIGLANFAINAGLFVVGLGAAWMVYKGGLLKGGGALVLITIVLLAGPNLIKLIPTPGGELEKVGQVLACMFKGDVTKCLAFGEQEEEPEAEKELDSYKAIEVEFGSKYTKPSSFTPPTIYANNTLGYFLPITVINPNPEEKKELTVKDFYVRSTKDVDNQYDQDADMFGGNYKIMCGVANDCNKDNPCELHPGRDKQITLYFEHGEEADCQTISNITVYEFDKYDEVGMKEKCEEDLGKKCEEENEECQACIEREMERECGDKCGDKYPLSNPVVEKEKCKCHREKNNFTELCDEETFGDEVKIKFAVNYTFSVKGRSDFRVAQTEDDIERLPEPKITTSAGPLSVTIYFVPDYIVKEKYVEGREIRMFISVKNDGEGRADIYSTLVELIQSQVSFTGTGIDDCNNNIPEKMSVNKGDSREVVCNLGLDETSLENFIGSFDILEINAQMNYTYIQSEDIVLPINTQYC